MESANQKTVVLMRGLPGCGKTYTARHIAGEAGLVLETDQYFYTEVGEDPSSYDFSNELLGSARLWNLQRFGTALQEQVPLIVVDRGNGINAETQQYAKLAEAYGYRIHLREPESAWWQELRVLLKYKEFVAPKLFDAWARKLSESTESGHRVPAATIRRWMARWKHDTSVDDILNFSPAELEREVNSPSGET